VTKKRASILGLLTVAAALVAVPLAGGSVTPIGGVYSAPPPCKGKAADGQALQGNSENDTIGGTSRIDVLRGGGGNDKINGRGGRDVIDTGSGNDRVTASRGADAAAALRAGGAEWVVIAGVSTGSTAGVARLPGSTTGVVVRVRGQCGQGLAVGAG